jgi:hypothetical protein
MVKGDESSSSWCRADAAPPSANLGHAWVSGCRAVELLLPLSPSLPAAAGYLREARLMYAEYLLLAGPQRALVSIRDQI